jgi:CBS domain containing-hemolysin-like protein
MARPGPARMIPPALILFFILALVVSFICSLLEATILSTRETHIELLVRAGKPSGKLLRSLKSRIDQPLIAILSLNTVANMLGAAGVGAEAQKWAEEQGWPAGTLVFVSSFVLTLSILVGAEIIPKTVGAAFWRPLCSPAAYILRVLVTVLKPIIWALEAIPSIIARKGASAGITPDEIAVLAELGRKRGTIPRRESEVIANLFALRNLKAKDVMTPRVEIFVLPGDSSAQEIVDQHPKLRFSRIPVYAENTDDIKGIVHRYRIFEACVKGSGQQTLATLARPAHFVPETKSIASLLDDFIKRAEHIFVVVNEFGGPEGIVTLEDVIETLLGVEIVDEFDTVDDLRKLARTKLEERHRRLAAMEHEDD